MHHTSILASFNPDLIDKNAACRDWAYKSGWQPKDITAAEFGELVDSGFAFSAQFSGGRRKAVNFTRASFIAADIDEGLTLADAEKHPLVAQYGTLIYKTPSHQIDGFDHFRIVFATPYVIDSPVIWSQALVGLARTLGSDMSATDGARLFYGSRGSSPQILENGLSEDALAELIRIGTEVKSQQTIRVKIRGFNGASTRSYRTIGPLVDIRCANGLLLKLAAIPPGTAVHCPFHEDRRPSAFIVESSKASPGVHCASCAETFWIEGRRRDSYDFYWFEKMASGIASRPTVEPASDLPAVPPGRLFAPMKRLPVLAEVLNTEFLPNFVVSCGVGLVRSPKGSGKTVSIEYIVNQARIMNKSVLLIGHRRTLLRELSQRLWLKCYLDDEDKGHFDHGKDTIRATQRLSDSRPDYYAVSIDSLALRLPRPRPYDVVIIDESEQVFTHVCAKTIANPQSVLNVLQQYIRVAPTVYAFDADLNRVTAGFVLRSRGRRWNEDGGVYQGETVRLIVNEFKPEKRCCIIYDSPTDLLSDFLADALAGKRIFFACNSKRKAEALDAWLRKKAPEVRTLVVTSESKVEERVVEFLRDVPTEFLKYDVVFASPAIGTGIDITFPNRAQAIDTVFGLFIGRINTHYDIDQQLGRVRNPGAVRIWISEEEEFFETEAAVIKRDLVETGRSHVKIDYFDELGNPSFDHSDPLLSLQVDAYAAQRASQNRLKHHFIEHKLHTGWQVEYLDQRQDSSPSDLQEVENEQERIKIAALMGAKKIDKKQYENYRSLAEGGEPIGIEAGREVKRYELEKFYGVELTAELIELDDDGRYQEAVARFESLQLHHDPGKVQYELGQYWMEDRWSEAFGENGVSHLLDAFLLSSGLVRADGSFNTDAVVTRSTLEPFIELCRLRKKTMEEVYRISLYVKQEIRCLGKVLGLVGLALEKVSAKKNGSQKIYSYRLNADRLDQMKLIVEQRRRARAAAQQAKIDAGIERINQFYRAKPPVALKFRQKNLIEKMLEKERAQNEAFAAELLRPTEDEPQ